MRLNQLTAKRIVAAAAARLSAGRLRLTDAAGYRTVQRVRREGLTFLGLAPLVELHQAVSKVEQAGIPGALVEAGCALGGSALVMAQAKARARPFLVFDVFGMIPPPSDRDGQDAHARYSEITARKAQGMGDQPYYGYQTGLLDKVIANFHAYGFAPQEHAIRFVQGLYEETLAAHLVAPIALAHIDCDWYDSVYVCLEEMVPRTAAGGVLVIDDYHEWSGCRDAVDDYFRTRRDEFAFHMKSRLHITRLP